jgi:hypothetical protein
VTPLKKLGMAIALPFAIVFGGLFIGGYKLFFSWWLDPKTHRKNHEQFEQEIRNRVSCLFTNYGGQIVPNNQDYPQAFDYAVITVAVDTMLLRFVRGRGDFRVDVCPKQMAGAWHEISLLVEHDPPYVEVKRKTEYYGIRDFGHFFQTNFDEIKAKVADEGWRPLKGWLIPVG